MFLVFTANFILAEEGSYIQFNPYNKLRLSSIIPNPYNFYHNIYSINKPNQDLAPFKPVLNQNYFSYLNNYKPYLLYKNIWGTNNWNYTVDINNTVFIIYEKITLPNTITSSGKKYTYNTKLPFIISIKEYINQRIKINNLIAYHAEVLSNFRVKEKPSQFTTGIYLLNKKIGDTHVAINLSGNISIECDLCYNKKSQQIIGNNSDSQWELEVEQTQSFSLESIIGNKLSIKANQNSMSDFDWENSLLLEYKGDENEIVKNITAGNISLNLPGTRIVSVGMGKRTGLFGIKIINQFGALNMQTIIGREKVSKSSISRSRDGSSEEGYTDIADYTFLRDTYFFIDKKFKENFYPIGLQGQVAIDTCYEINEFELFEKMGTSFGANDNNTGTFSGAAYVNPGNMEDSGFGITGTWRKLEKGEDYYIDIERGMKKRGYIRLSGSTSKVLAAHYTIKECSLQDTLLNTGTDMDFVYNDDFIADECLNENDCINNDSNLIEGIDYAELNGPSGFQGKQLTLKLIKEATGTSDPFSCPNTYPLMFKNVYNLAGQNINQNSLDVKIIHKNGVTGNETDLDGRPLLKIFGLDNVDNVTQQIDTTSGGDGRIDVSNGAILDLARGDLLLPFHMPFAFEDTRSSTNRVKLILVEKIWGNTSRRIEKII